MFGLFALLLLALPLRVSESFVRLENANERLTTQPPPPVIFGGAHSRWPSGFL
jgi:hypothetical protein